MSRRNNTRLRRENTELRARIAELERQLRAKREQAAALDDELSEQIARREQETYHARRLERQLKAERQEAEDRAAEARQIGHDLERARAYGESYRVEQLERKLRNL